MRTKRALTAGLLLAGLGIGLCLFLPGCYWSHIAAGQAELLWNRRPVGELLADPATGAELRDRLELVERVRAFGADLGLDVDGQYTSFVAVPRDAVVTTVVATRPGELEPAGFWFPVVGRLPYKGYFDPARATHEADRLRADGLDVCLSSVVAYSTLGWFEDPLTTPLLRLEEGALVETLLHELTHATVFARGDADFNEGLATFVGGEAAQRFWRHHFGADAARTRDEQTRLAESRLLARERERFGAAVEALYAELAPGPERTLRRRALEEQARARLATLPLATRDPERLADRLRLNDACLALRGAYEADLPAHARVLADLDGDLGAFLARARAAEDEADPRCALLGVCASAQPQP